MTIVQGYAVDEDSGEGHRIFGTICDPDKPFEPSYDGGSIMGSTYYFLPEQQKFFFSGWHPIGTYTGTGPYSINLNSGGASGFLTIISSRWTWVAPLGTGTVTGVGGRLTLNPPPPDACK
jgi:hypothetical protein